MRVLICTQVVDAADSNLGFFVEWIRAFAEHGERVEVICLREGRYDLPTNVRIHALRRAAKNSSLYGRVFGRRVLETFRFWSLVWRLRGEYDAVFVHMNPEYIVLGGVLWRLWHKPIGLWYAHKSVTLKLRIATLLANHVFTVSPESFRIGTKKKHAMGHGIDTDRFQSASRTASATLRIITIGRMSASKHLIEMLLVLDILHARDTKFSFAIIGEPITTADRDYETELIREIRLRPYHAAVHLAGAVSHSKLAHELAASDVFLNFSTTGNMDKAGLEALAAGIPLVTTNTKFAEIAHAQGVFLAHTPAKLAEAIDIARHADASEAAALVREQHSLARLIPRILAVLSTP